MMTPDPAGVTQDADNGVSHAPTRRPSSRFGHAVRRGKRAGGAVEVWSWN